MKTNKRFFNSYNKEGRKNNVYADTRPVRVDVFETRDADSHHRLRFVRENLRVGENEGTFQRLAADSQEHIKPTVGLNVAKIENFLGVQWTFWDLGGLERLRPIWLKYYRESHGIFSSLTLWMRRE